MKKYCFGVDVGGTTIKLGLFETDTDGKLLEKWEIETCRGHEGEAILPDIAASINMKIIERHIDKTEVEGIGIGVPAPIDEDGIVQKTANLGWGYKEVKRELEDLTELQICTGNDANVAALGEMWKGGGKGYKNLVLVTLGTGVGGGIIVNGKIMAGASGAGGEIGHMLVNPQERERCGCGNKGCLEQYASATGIVRLARKILAKHPHETGLDAGTVTAKDVFDAVKEGNITAMEIAREFGRYLGLALVNVAVITDPEAIVIGGGVSKAGEILLDYIRGPYMDRSFHANKNVIFTLATLGNDAGIYGAARMLIE